MAADPLKPLLDVMDAQSILLGEVIGLLLAAGVISGDAL